MNGSIARIYKIRYILSITNRTTIICLRKGYEEITIVEWYYAVMLNLLLWYGTEYSRIKYYGLFFIENPDILKFSCILFGMYPRKYLIRIKCFVVFPLLFCGIKYNPIYRCYDDKNHPSKKQGDFFLCWNLF